MTSPIESAGYTDLRSYVESNWTTIALLDSNDSEITRIDLESDGRVNLVSDSATNPLEYEITITGSDSDISLPVTIDTTEVYKSSSATTRMGTDTYSDATIKKSQDEVTITHQIALPQL
jgi:hypothetical protein